MLIFYGFVKVIGIRDIMPPPNLHDFEDIYVVYELMDTDLNQVIRSRQSLTEEHCQVLWSLSSSFKSLFDKLCLMIVKFLHSK